MNQPFFRMLRIVFVALDLFMVNLSFALMKYIYSTKLPLVYEVEYYYLWLFMNIAWLLASSIGSVYKPGNIATFEFFSRHTVRGYIYFIMLTLLYLFLFKLNIISRSFIIMTFACIGVAILLNRLIYLIIIFYSRNRDYLVRKVIIIGYNEFAKKLVKQLEEDVISTRVVGYCESEEEIRELSNYPILGDLSDIIEISKQNNVSEIYSTLLPDQNETIYKLIQKANESCIRFRVIPNFDFFTRFPVHIDYMGSFPVFSFRREPLDDVTNRIRKRLFDLMVSSLVIILILSWLIPLVWIIMQFDSKGPLFFLQERTGKNNKVFKCIKFRSMKVNNDANTMQAVKGDERVTRFGRFLRSSSIDEFPQFINVFLGDMSVVGPRPHMLKHTVDYAKKINAYMVRQFIKPGITGWAQVHGFRGETRTLRDMQNRVESDLWYLENWSLWLDTRIIFLTVLNIFRGEANAY